MEYSMKCWVEKAYKLILDFGNVNQPHTFTEKRHCGHFGGGNYQYWDSKG